MLAAADNTADASSHATRKASERAAQICGSTPLPTFEALASFAMAFSQRLFSGSAKRAHSNDGRTRASRIPGSA